MRRINDTLDEAWLVRDPCGGQPNDLSTWVGTQPNDLPIWVGFPTQ